MATDGPAPAGVPAPLEHLLLLVVTLLPLFVPVPTNLNIVSTAAACVLCGCWRSVKPEPPAESMTRKASQSCTHTDPASPWAPFLHPSSPSPLF